jgi:hypothetical protein
MSRPKFSEQVNLSMVELRRWEEGRRLLTTEQLQRIMRHPIMGDLQRRAVEAGIVPPRTTDLMSDQPKTTDLKSDQPGNSPDQGGPQDRDIENQGGPQHPVHELKGDPNDGDGDGGSGT